MAETKDVLSNAQETLDGLLKKFGKEGQMNVSDNERKASVIGGGLLAIYGLIRNDLGGLALLGLGGSLLWRGLTGQCSVYKALNLNTAKTNDVQSATATVDASKAIKVKHSVTINKSAEELYKFWRNFENLPRIMNHLDRVDVTSDKRSHWVAKAPAGLKVEWDAEIINEKENELIAWKSLEGANIANAGSVQFKDLGFGRGTEVKVEIDYEPPAGALGAIVAKLLGEEPNTQVQEDLRLFKQMMETGEAPTGGTPSAREGATAKPDTSKKDNISNYPSTTLNLRNEGESNFLS